MGQRTIAGSQKLAEAIRRRRHELDLTIEEAAQRAGVGTKTWCRYEAGESIRRDKYKGICRALNWDILSEDAASKEDIFDLEPYRSHTAWSSYIAENYGDIAAISLVMGSDLLLDSIKEDLTDLSSMPRGSHIGQLPASWLSDFMPPQFLTRYDYEFLYSMQAALLRLQKRACQQDGFPIRSVLEELIVYIAVEKAEVLIDSMAPQMRAAGIRIPHDWKDWIFDLFWDDDLVTCLFCGGCLPPSHTYHFIHWTKEQFQV